MSSTLSAAIWLGCNLFDSAFTRIVYPLAHARGRRLAAMEVQRTLVLQLSNYRQNVTPRVGFLLKKYHHDRDRKQHPDYQSSL